MKSIESVVELIEKYHDGIVARLSERRKVTNRTYHRNAIEKYCSIKKEFEVWDGQFDSDFCADFIDFYQVRLNRAKKEKSDLFCKIYFEVFKEMKDRNETNFSTVIEVMQERLSDITSGVQTSFVSKLIHTINNNAAIYDRYVKKVLGLWDSGCLPQIQQFIDENRSSLEPLVDDIISRAVGKSEAAIVSGVTISYTKKCDFVLWQLGWHLKSKNKQEGGIKMENINYLVESQDNNDKMLAGLVQKGLQKRYKKPTPAVVERADRELKVITECGFSRCFLVVYDICRFARSKKIEISSRGTTACSLVNYLLEITEIDPLVYNLPFERFLNSDYLMSKRGAVHPFFGLDFSIDYDEINSVVVKYLKKKYGKSNVLRCVGENKGRLFIHGSTLLIDAQMQEKVEIIKFDGQDVANVMGIGADRLGIFQVDFFSLQSLKLLNEMKSVLDSNGKKQFAKACECYADEATLSLFREGKTEDIFQFQSPAIIEQVKQMPVVTFDTLLAMMALYRPGSMDRIPEYLDSNCADETIRFLYQEDVINFLHEIGFSLNEADTIRKDISKRKIAEIECYRERFMQYAAKKGMDAADATVEWEELNSYVLYSFCKAHAVAYMMLAYKLAYLKAHYPDEWKVAIEKISESAD